MRTNNSLTVQSALSVLTLCAIATLMTKSQPRKVRFELDLEHIGCRNLVVCHWNIAKRQLMHVSGSHIAAIIVLA